MKTTVAFLSIDPPTNEPSPLFGISVSRGTSTAEFLPSTGDLVVRHVEGSTSKCYRVTDRSFGFSPGEVEIRIFLTFVGDTKGVYQPAIPGPAISATSTPTPFHAHAPPQGAPLPPAAPPRGAYPARSP